METIKVLHVVPNMQAGGLETLLMNIMRNINRDKIQFDFLVHYKERKFYDDEIEQLGGKIYCFSVREDSNFLKYIWQLNKFFKTHKEYKIVHCHMPSVGFLVLLIAKIHGVKVRVAHSHNNSCENTLKGRIKRFLIQFEKYLSTDNFACSNDAGKFLFGNRKFTVLPNAIDLDRFKFNGAKRKQIRNELGIDDDTMVIGHVGRFCEQKNHNKLIDIFYNYQKTNKNSVLVLVGEGELLESIKEKCKNLNIDNKVKFLGIRRDTDFLYSAFDAFVFPSLFEGLGIVLIEAQMSGLKCYTTDVFVSKEALISDRLTYLKQDDKRWDTKIAKDNKYDRINVKFNDNKNNYDIKTLCQRLERFYLKGK